MVLLNNFEFMVQLQTIAASAKNDSSFAVTFKRYDGHDVPEPRAGKPPLPEPDEYKCLVRAQTKSKKISTIVTKDDVPKVMSQYSVFMRNHMDGLKRVKKIKSKVKVAKG